MKKLFLYIAILLMLFPVCKANAYTFDDIKNYSLEKFNEGLAYLTISINDNETDTSFSKLWNTSIEKMEEGLEYLNSGKEKDHKEWYRIGQNPKFKNIIQETFEILSVSDAKEKIDLTIEYRRNIVLLHKENSILIKKIPGAPEKAQGFVDSTLTMLDLYDDKESINQKITQNKQEIRRLESEVAKIKDAFYKDIQSKGLRISKEQVESLFSSVDGEEIISIIGMAQNIKTIQLELHKLIKEEPDNIELLKSYSGIYMMLNETLLFAYEEAISKIENTYIPKLETIIANSEKELGIANNKLTTTSEQNKHILNSNIDSNLMTIDVGQRYKRYLQKQIQFLKQEKHRINDTVEVATNTYNTIKNSGDLLALIRESESDINRITSFQVPELEVFHDEALRKEFDAITIRLQI